ncbi:MAG: hypothetical protein R2827_12375 [Bdellovibrionales bacterium]
MHLSPKYLIGIILFFSSIQLSFAGSDHWVMDTGFAQLCESKKGKLYQGPSWIGLKQTRDFYCFTDSEVFRKDENDHNNYDDISGGFLAGTYKRLEKFGADNLIADFSQLEINEGNPLNQINAGLPEICTSDRVRNEGIEELCKQCASENNNESTATQVCVAQRKGPINNSDSEGADPTTAELIAQWCSGLDGTTRLACVQCVQNGANDISNCVQERVSGGSPSSETVGGSNNTQNSPYFTGDYGGTIDKIFAQSCQAIEGQSSLARQPTGTDAAGNVLDYQVGSSDCERKLASFKQECRGNDFECAHRWAEEICYNGSQNCIQAVYQEAGFRTSQEIWAWFRSQGVDQYTWELVNASMNGDREIAELINCETKNEEAVRCCGDPMSCAVGNKQVGQGLNTVVTLGTPGHSGARFGHEHW